MLVAFISLPFNMHPIISNVYWELATHICWMENNPDVHLLKVLVCLLLYLESDQVIILWKVLKRLKKTRNLLFAFITGFAWILSTLRNLLCYLLQLQIWFQIKQINTFEIHCVTTSDKTGNFILGLVDLGFEIQKTNFGIRICNLKIQCVPIFRQNE